MCINSTHLFYLLHIFFPWVEEGQSIAGDRDIGLNVLPQLFKAAPFCLWLYAGFTFHSSKLLGGRDETQLFTGLGMFRFNHTFLG